MTLQILHNHIGYETAAAKLALVRSDESLDGVEFVVLRHPDARVVHRGTLRAVGKVEGWRDWQFFRADFSELDQAGSYALRIQPERGLEPFDPRLGAPFRVADDLLRSTLLSDHIDYFKTQRCTGAFDRRDANVDFYGESGRKADVHGGWYDASGDTSKYLSHLSYANFMNPQQTPLLPWAFMHAVESLGDADDVFSVNYRRRLLDEAAHGGDFLVRMQDEAGFFYMTVFDKWTKDLDERQICAYATQQGHRSEAWQAGYRQGGGLAIAALARLARNGVEGDFGPADYLDRAKRGFAHLEEHNREYLDNGEENIIDDYCALLAAIELHRATSEDRYLEAARVRARSLIERQSADDRFDGWFRADAERRPYFHAAEAGLPVIALLQYRAIETDDTQRDRALQTVARALKFELAITGAVNNPFGYPRQYTQDVNGTVSDRFFVPHENETGYWWQGENARLGSLAAASRLAAVELTEDPELAKRLRDFAGDCMNWVLGLNPYDMCMVHGHGHNNPEYEDGFPQSAGGICNGITAGFEDERDIDFQPSSCEGRGDQVWRWGEQWIPHAAWFIVALCSPRG